MGGKRVLKSNPRIEAFGTVDELNANLGLLRDLEIPVDIKNDLLIIQNKLFVIGSILACEVEPNQYYLENIDESDISGIENRIDDMENNLPTLKNFILPGGHIAVSQCHICRCVCRRAERSIVSLAESDVQEELIIKYLNRLSDYFFVLARRIGKELGIKEINWVPGA